MFENLYDFEALYRIRRDEMEQKLEECRKLKIAPRRKDKPGQRGTALLVLQFFRNIFK